MSGINPVSGVSGHIRPTTAPAVRPDQQAGKAGFGDVLNRFVTDASTDQKASTDAIRDLVTGQTDDVLPVVQAVAKADLSFKLLIGVRNKVIEAYKQTMNMQI